MSNRKNYTVLVAFPKGGGHWAKKGDTLELLDVEAMALRRAGRIKLTSEVTAEAPAAPVAEATPKKATAKE
ncbi:hypothetical protein SAMN05216600_12836 [Pseudomonas cuatrocienegasensis]|uniref:Uncharacterized protein n=1 Tax=Pseudomonas cuatrocienegasensis TaxID=543360 RepID=A0ABY1BR09_9PSED|nr:MULTISPECIES: hypothetical protein [Pseudomonas]OEC32885.1 hypothetical protein A7D25_21825 [Pseudomonas sp. 21C1]SER41433.1 hypothetical protein SAMN05216600_12836 [Pseudomonas cuatrocienegasensis]